LSEPSHDQTIESLDLSLGKIFSDFYVVPSYQREYVWGVEQVERLMRDIHDAFPESGQPMTEYFIGSLVVCPGEGGVLELIDGQQRMTTAYLFLCCVRDQLLELGASPPDVLAFQIAATQMDDRGREVPRYRVSLQYEDSLDVLTRIATRSIDMAHVTGATRSVANIIGAYETIRAFLATEFDGNVDEIRRFYAYFINRVKLVRIKTEDIAHALKVFETINDRGIGLDSMDLLKNLMFMKAEKTQFESLKNAWKDLVDTLHRAGEKPLRFLRYFVFSQYDVDRLREDEIYDWFVKNAKLCGYDADPLNFVELLRHTARAYTTFVSGNNLDGSQNLYLTNLRYLSGAARQQLILLLAGKHLRKDDFTELCRQLENLFFAVIITREPTKEFERQFARWAPALRIVETSSQLREFLASTFQPMKQQLLNRFELAFRELRETSIQRYRMRYILGKITQYVNDTAYAGAKVDLGQFMAAQDIEHILSQSPTAEVLASFDMPYAVDDYVHRLGNLTLLEQSINVSISNKPFSQKVKGYAQSRYLLTRSIAERVHVGSDTRIDRAATLLVTFEEWSSRSVERRQEMLAQLALQVWDMPVEGRSADSGGP